MTHNKLILMAGLMALVLSGETQAQSPQHLIDAHDSEMTQQHDMIQDDIATLQAAVDALEPGKAPPPCGAGTGNAHFVVQGYEVCDNTTGLYGRRTRIQVYEIMRMP